MVLVKVDAGDETGLGNTYAPKATGAFIEETKNEVVGKDALDIPAASPGHQRCHTQPWRDGSPRARSGPEP